MLGKPCTALTGRESTDDRQTKEQVWARVRAREWPSWMFLKSLKELVLPGLQVPFTESRLLS